MALAVGVRLGPYEIRSLLGAGGMGEVYKAYDTRLDRTVALKILPERVADDPDRRQRFEQEARAVSALNHPHICTLHDIGSAPSTAAAGPNVDYLVMEHVEGQTLAEHLGKRPVPLSQALEYAIQIADALACAHDARIVHRDLKPGNIMLTKGGVKLLDFGLAKLKAPATTTAAAGASELLTRNPTTTPGSVLGTVQYMAPEQLEGREVDARADLWAFGCVLYEMTTGCQAFQGRSQASLIAAIMEHEPAAMKTLDPMSPPLVEHLVRRCLAKDPEERWQSARDVLHELKWVAEAAAHAGVPANGPARRRRTLLPWLAAAILTAAGAAWVGYVVGLRARAPLEAQQLGIDLPAQQEIAIEGGVAQMTFSPDGGTLVFPGRQDGRQYLFRRDLHDRQASAIRGTDDGNMPFFSPDGRWIGFNGREGLMKVRAEGGRPLPITRANFGAGWLSDGTVIYTPNYTEGLFRISADGGGAQRLTTPEHARGELGHWWPDVLPGDRFVIFTSPRTPIDRSRVEVIDLQTHEVRVIVDGGFFGRYAPTGHLLYVKGRRLFAQPFDPANARPNGAAVVVLDDVFTNDENACASYAVSSRGALAYIAEAVGNPPRELVWLDREGRRTPATSERRAYRSVSLSHDGRRAAVMLSEENDDVWTVSDRGTLSRETTSEIGGGYPKWSRDDRELFYVVSTPDHPNYELYRMDVGKPDSGRPIWDDHVGVDTFQIAISPDGRTLAFVRQEPETGRNIYTRPLDGSAPARAFRATRAQEQFPSFSPDGRWIAYESDETGRPEIYVDPFGPSGDHKQITSDGGTQPVWAARSGEIVYRAGDEIRVVRTRLAKGFEFDAPQRFFRLATPGEGRGMFDVTPDGKRIIAVTIPEASRPRQIDLVLDWAARLARENR